MTNAKKLTNAQIAALRFLADGRNPFVLFGRRKPNCGTITTLRALDKRGLISTHAGSVWGVTITPAGRQALFEATGEHWTHEPEHIRDVMKRAIDKIKEGKE